MKYQILISYLLFTQLFYAQDSNIWSLTADGSEENEYYDLLAENTPDDMVLDFNSIPEDEIFNSLKFLSYNNGLIEDVIYLDSIDNRNQDFIDKKSDSLNNEYLLFCRTENDKKMLVLQKYSSNEVLLWEYTVECLNGNSFEPNSLTLLDDSHIFIACYKGMEKENQQSTLFCLNNEGDFLKEIVFK